MPFVYVHSTYPSADRKSRRYVAFQLEYYPTVFQTAHTREFLDNAALIWEYSRRHMSKGLPYNTSTPVRYVRV